MTIEKNPRSIRLVVFDVEGILLPKRRYLLFEVARKLSFLSFLRITFYGFLYEMGLSPLGSALRRIFRVLRGLTVDNLFEVYRRIPLMLGVKEVFAELNELGCKTALISSGLPTVIVEDLATRLRADYAFGLKLQVNKGHLTGEIEGDVLKPKGKALVLKAIMEKEGMSPNDCVVVVDDRNNLPMFPLCGVSIGYNPDFILSYKSDFAVSGDLTNILPVIRENVVKAPTFPSSRDFIRETIHIGSFLVPIVCQYLFNPFGMFSLIFIVTILYTVSELARLEGKDLPIFSSVTWRATTKTELYEFATAPILFASGIMLSLILFPPPISYASIATLTLGDGFATIFGKIFGRTRFPFNKGKTLEGSICGFAFALVGATLFVSPSKALIGALVGMIVESLPLPFSDNVMVPLVSGIALLGLP